VSGAILLESPQHHRAKKGQAVLRGDHATAAEADIALRAHRVAKAIRLATEGRPPLPPDVIDALRNLLPPTPAGR
jgi:hypothetical protein